MKKYFLLALGLCMTMAFTTSCKSSESAYKKAYEKAKQQELAEATGKSLSTVKRIMKSLQEKQYICREGGKKYGKWEIIHRD